MLGMQMLRVLLTYDVAKGKGAVYADAACVADICLLLCLANAVVGAEVLGAVTLSALAECSCSDEFCYKCCCCRMYRGYSAVYADAAIGGRWARALFSLRAIAVCNIRNSRLLYSPDTCSGAPSSSES